MNDQPSKRREIPSAQRAAGNAEIEQPASPRGANSGALIHAPRRDALRLGLSALGALGGARASQAQRTAADSGRLVLKRDELVLKMKGLFEELRGNKQARADFASDPTGAIVKHILPPGSKPISPRRISNANRVLYAILEDERFRGWIEDYQAKLATLPKVDKQQVVKDLAQAMARFGSAALSLGMIEELRLREPAPLDAFLVFVEATAVTTQIQAVFDVVVIVASGRIDLAKQLVVQPAELRAIAARMDAEAARFARNPDELMRVDLEPR